MVTESRQLTIADLIGRALSRSNTSPEVLAKGRAKFEAQIADALEPFVRDGVLAEQIEARASIFAPSPKGFALGEAIYCAIINSG